jgi:hypothetical protein
MCWSHSTSGQYQTVSSVWYRPLAIGRSQAHRPDDFRPPPAKKAARQIKDPVRIAMKTKLKTDNAKALYKKCQLRFRLRGISNVATAWKLVALAYNCRRIANLENA